MYECSLERMTDKIKTMSQFGDAGHGGITRYSLSPEALQARGEFVRRMEAIGATIKFDDMANLYATLPGSEPDLPCIVYFFYGNRASFVLYGCIVIVTGSHDSVV